MGFTIHEPVLIEELGLTLSNIYCSLKGEFSIHRTPYDGKYTLVGNIFMYANQSASACLKQRRVWVDFQSADYPSNPIGMLYEYSKTLFPDKTFTDE